VGQQSPQKRSVVVIGAVAGRCLVMVSCAYLGLRHNPLRPAHIWRGLQNDSACHGYAARLATALFPARPKLPAWLVPSLPPLLQGIAPKWVDRIHTQDQPAKMGFLPELRVWSLWARPWSWLPHTRVWAIALGLVLRLLVAA